MIIGLLPKFYEIRDDLGEECGWRRARCPLRPKYPVCRYRSALWVLETMPILGERLDAAGQDCGQEVHMSVMGAELAAFPSGARWYIASSVARRR